MTQDATELMPKTLASLTDTSDYFPGFVNLSQTEKGVSIVMRETSKMDATGKVMVGTVAELTIRNEDFHKFLHELNESTRTAPASPQDIEGLKINKEPLYMSQRDYGWNAAIDEMIRRGWRLPGDEVSEAATALDQCLETIKAIGIESPVVLTEKITRWIVQWESALAGIRAAETGQSGGNDA